MHSYTLPKTRHVEKVHFLLECFVRGDDQVIFGHNLGINEPLGAYAVVHVDFETGLLVYVLGNFVVPLIANGGRRDDQRGRGQARRTGAT